jgi:hypothetical protein
MYEVAFHSIKTPDRWIFDRQIWPHRATLGISNISHIPLSTGSPRHQYIIGLQNQMACSGELWL